MLRLITDGRISPEEAVRAYTLGSAYAEFADHVIIGGFGRVGQTVARMLEMPFYHPVIEEGLRTGDADLDGDGAPEVYLSNDFGPDRLLHHDDRVVRHAQLPALVIVAGSFWFVERIWRTS